MNIRLTQPNSFRNISLKWKFFAVVVFIVFFISGVQNIIFYQVDINAFTHNLKNKVSVLAIVLANNSTSAVQFDNRLDALEILSSLEQVPSVRSAYLFGEKNELLAEYLADGEVLSVPLSVTREGGLFLTEDRLVVRQPVTLNGKKIGVLYLNADFRDLEARTVFRTILWCSMLLGAVILTITMTLWGKRFFIQPILDLANLSHRVGAEQKYSLRANKTSNDELGTLTESFNTMLDAIEERDRAIAAQTQALQESNKKLEKARNTLEIRVEERTREITVMMKELEASNEDLEQKSQELQAQQEELQQTNEELEEQRSALEDEKEKLESLTRELAASQAAFEEKAHEADIANKYKSEFLANMSHELRTPLNSIMILSQILGENIGRNLTGEQVKNAKTIYSSGNDLLVLINDILDLSKIEAGKLELNIDTVNLTQIVDNLRDTFALQMQKKSLDFQIKSDTDVPATIRSDQVRLEQILKNLVSNAMKFTEKGSVKVYFKMKPGEDKARFLQINVEDSGIGIPRDKQTTVFEAFRQIDSSLSRRYSGTGLGLSISQTLAQKLGGFITLQSTLNKGSIFTLCIPTDSDGSSRNINVQHQTGRELAETVSHNMPVYSSLSDDSKQLNEDDQVILIIEDDPRFTETLIDKCRKAGFKCLHAHNGIAGLEMAALYLPKAIILDVRLPRLNGIDVLDRLKSDPETRHIPVSVISIENCENEVLQLGAFSFLQKPISMDDLNRTIKQIETLSLRETRNVLLVEDDKKQCDAITQLLNGKKIKTKSAHSVKEALEYLREYHYDCIILDLDLNGEDGLAVLTSPQYSSSENQPSVIVYTGKELSKQELRKIEQLTDSVIIKGSDSPARLLDEVTLFLHSLQIKKTLPVADIVKKNKPLIEDSFQGKKVLLVDDDMRNIYSLRQVLLSRGFNCVQAHTGIEALEALKRDNEIDIVLMDIMMPEMNGIEATEAIRKQYKFANLPIIALTAKAMKQDREDCLRAGVSDYLAKPVDVGKLLSMMRVWLSK